MFYSRTLSTAKTTYRVEKLNLSTKHWWNDTDMGKCSTQIKTCPVALCSPQIPGIDYCHVYIYFTLLFSLFNDLDIYFHVCISMARQP